MTQTRWQSAQINFNKQSMLHTVELEEKNSTCPPGGPDQLCKLSPAQEAAIEDKTQLMSILTEFVQNHKKGRTLMVYGVS